MLTDQESLVRRLSESSRVMLPQERQEQLLKYPLKEKAMPTVPNLLLLSSPEAALTTPQQGWVKLPVLASTPWAE
jgi:hypothetical protein